MLVHILRKVYTTHMRGACDLKGGSRNDKISQAPSFLSSIVHRAFPLEAHNYGSPEQLVSETLMNNSFSVWSKS